MKTYGDQCRDLANHIREGAKRSRPYTGWMSDGRACALGAAWLSLTGKQAAKEEYEDNPQIVFSNDLTDAMPVLQVAVNSPKGSGVPKGWSLESTIMELNDEKRWSREHIANYVECLGTLFDEGKGDADTE